MRPGAGYLTQRLDGDMAVDLAAARRTMAKHLGNLIQGGTVPHHARCEPVSKQVGCSSTVCSAEPAPAQGESDDVPDRCRTGEATERGAASQEHPP
jgi:hypothetical protein